MPQSPASPIAPNRLHAVVVLPAGVRARERCPAERRWLARGTASASGAPAEPLQRALGVLGRPAIGEGLAALRKWGQTGERPAGWLCGADPVYFEPRLDHLCLFALADLGDAEFASLMSELQTRLAADRDYSFSQVGSCGYLQGSGTMATAAVSPLTAQGESPERFLPTGEGTAAHDRLQSELQMCLHDLPVNRRREDEGRPPVNALWFWGGGSAPAQGDIDPFLPPLFSDDPLATGYWLAAGARCDAWPGAFEQCLEAASGTFVAVVPRQAADGGGLDALRTLLSRGDLRRVTLLFGDGIRIDLRAGDRFRFWRRELALPGEDDAG